jgi:hypothetical protein
VGDQHARNLACILPGGSRFLEPLGLIFKSRDYRREQPAINTALAPTPCGTL